MNFNSIYEEKLYRKRMSALKRYFSKVYKHLTLHVVPKLSEPNKKDGEYEYVLPTSKLFEKVYGNITLYFYVKDDKAYFEDILPKDILLACYEKNLPSYRGVPYDNEKDLKKLKIVEKLIWAMKNTMEKEI